MSNITADNSGQPGDFEEIATIIWYSVVGIGGLIGNAFVIAVTSARSRLNSSHMVIIWLACTDIIGCLTVPIRYRLFYQNTSQTWCHVGFWTVPFVFFLSINSLGMVAIERYKSVQNLGRNEHLSGKAVLTLSVLCIVVSFLYTFPIVWFLMVVETSCSNLYSSLDIQADPRYAAVIFPSIFSVMSMFILITVLYVKICILVRSRVGRQPNPTDSVQQFPTKSSSSGLVEPVTENKPEHVIFSWQRKGQMNLHQVIRDGDEECIQDVSDAVNTSTRPARVSGISLIFEPSQPESISSCECQIPGPSTDPIPCTVMDGHDIERQDQLPKVRSTTIQGGDSGNDEPVIPVLNDNQYRQNFMITRRVTSMLFIVTLVFFVTYVISCTTLFISDRVVKRCVREFALINYIINPVIYSVVNQGFREHCISSVQRIRERFSFKF